MSEGSGQQRSAGWKKDPSGRHFGRYWDGHQWTEHVISAEKVQSIDPQPPRSEPPMLSDSPPAPSGGAPSGPGRSTTGQLAYSAGRGMHQALAAARGWPRWVHLSLGIATVLIIMIAAASSGSDEGSPMTTTDRTYPVLDAKASRAAECEARVIVFTNALMENQLAGYTAGVEAVQREFMAQVGTDSAEYRAVFSSGFLSLVLQTAVRQGREAGTVTISDLAGAACRRSLP